MEKMNYSLSKRYSLEVADRVFEACQKMAEWTHGDCFLARLANGIANDCVPSSENELFYAMEDLRGDCEALVKGEFFYYPSEETLREYQKFSLSQLLRRAYQVLIVCEMNNNRDAIIYNSLVERFNNDYEAANLDFEITPSTEELISTKFHIFSRDKTLYTRVTDISRVYEAILDIVRRELRTTAGMIARFEQEQEQEIIEAEIVEAPEEIDSTELVIDVIPSEAIPALEAPKAKAPKRKRKELSIDMNNKVFKTALDNIRTLLDRKAAMYELEFARG